MAVMLKTTTMVAAVQTLVGTDMSAEAEFFPNQITHLSEAIEYDVQTQNGRAANYVSFAESAEYIKNDGYDTVKVAPFNINTKVKKDLFDMEAKKFGATVYENGGYDTDAAVMAQRAHLPALIRRKKMMGSIFAYGKLTKARDGIDAEFNIPTANNVVLTKKWNLSTDNPVPIADIKYLVRTMKSKPTRILMNPVTWGMMIANGTDVVINQNATTENKPQNVYINQAADNDALLRKVASIIDGEINLDVYLWSDEEDGVGYYIPDGYVSFSRKGAGERHFGGVPVVSGNDATIRAVEFDISTVVTIDPPFVGKIYKSAPLYVPKNNEGWGFIKTY